MMSRFTGTYTDDWPEVAKAAKDLAGWKCVRCGHPHEPKAGYTLTCHHLDGDKSNNAWWNVAALCQRCHLTIQAKVIMERPWMFEHSSWFRLFVAGYNSHQRGLPDDREYVMAHIDELLTSKDGEL